MARRRSRLNQRRSNLLRDDLYSYLLAGGIRPEAAHYIDAHIAMLDARHAFFLNSEGVIEEV